MEIWEYLILFFSVVLGGGLALYLKPLDKVYLQTALSFSGAYILGITVLHLMPSVFYGGEHKFGLWILLGFFIQLLLEQLSGGVEHGHIHAPHTANSQFALQLMLGLCLHAFMEGLPLGGYESFHATVHPDHNHGHQHFLWGIILHKAPAAFALITLLKIAGYSRKLILTCLVIFALMSPLGASMAALLIEKNVIEPEVERIIIAVVVGSFLHIATTIIFEVDSSKHHRISMKKLTAIGLGIGMSLFTI